MTTMKDDMISKQAALDCVYGTSPNKIKGRIAELPSVQSVTNERRAVERAEVLLKVVYILLNKQAESHYVLNLLEETVFYDDAICDGSCLKDDIEYWFDEFSEIDLTGDNNE